MASASGGVAPYTYSWSPAASITMGANAAMAKANPSASTNYIVTITDANGCTTTARVYVDVVDVTCGKKGDKVLICHKESKRRKGQTITSYHEICVAKSAVAAHLKHGDNLGLCNNSAKNGGIAKAEAHCHIFPNPNCALFTVQLHGELAQDVQLIVRDMQGRTLVHKIETSAVGTTEYAIDIQSYAAGVYMMQIVIGAEIYSERIIKE